jgi:hypothetical protein
VINTTLGAASFRISELQKTGSSLAPQLQALRERVAAEEAPAEIARRAYQLGMRTQTGVTILDLRTNRTYVLAGQSGVGIELGATPAASAAASTTTSKKSAGAKTPAPAATPNASSTPVPTASSTAARAGSSR